MRMEFVSRALFKIEELKARLATVEAERDAARAEVERLREDAARARWCEEHEADVLLTPFSRVWMVVWIADGFRHIEASDRNAAIDAAMKGGK